MSHLHYNLGELFSIAASLFPLFGRQHTAQLVGFEVNYLDKASFRVVAFEVFVRGEYFFETNQDSPVILDCGANIGLATLFFKRLYPNARIHSFEADPTTCGVLRSNIEQNHLQGVTVTNVLLSDHNGAEKFYVSSGAAGSLMMSATASRFAADGQEITVNAGRLSDYIDGSVDLLKLDVEGSEFCVMRDLVASGKVSHIERMVIEYHHRIGNEPSRLASFLQLLENAGFEYYLNARFSRKSDTSYFQDILIGAYRA